MKFARNKWSDIYDHLQKEYQNKKNGGSASLSGKQEHFLLNQSIIIN